MAGPTKPAFCVGIPAPAGFLLRVNYSGGGPGDSFGAPGTAAAVLFMGAGDDTENWVSLLEEAFNGEATTHGYTWAVTLSGDTLRIVASGGGPAVITDLEFLQPDVISSADLGFGIDPADTTIAPTTEGGDTVFQAAFSPRWRWRPGEYLAGARAVPVRTARALLTEEGNLTTVVKGQYTEHTITVEYVPGDRVYKWAVNSDYLATTLPQFDTNGTFEQLWLDYGALVDDNGQAPELRFVPDETAPETYVAGYLFDEEQLNDIAAVFSGDADTTPLFFGMRLYMVQK